MANSGSSRKQQRLKIEEIGRTLAECGFVALDEQAYVLGLSRSTAWTVIRGTHKTSGLSAMTINRMLATDHLPLRVRLKLLEYIAEKMSGAYGDQEHRLKAFASKIPPVHMFLVEPNQAGRLSCVDPLLMPLRRFDGARRSAAPTLSTNTGGDYSSRDISRTASRGAAAFWSLSKYTNTSRPCRRHFLTYSAQRSSVLFG